MKKNVKRLIGLLLVTVLLITMVPLSTLAKPATTGANVKVRTAGIASDYATSDESANDLDSSVNGIVQCPDGRWAMYKNGKVDTSCTSIEQNKYGWWRIKDGYVDFEAQGIYQNRNGWWKTTNGKVTFKEFGLFENENGTWRVEFSKVNFKANSIYQGKDGWYKTTNGKVTFDETGVFQNQFGWWYVNNSKVDFDFTGISSNSFGKWYINNGKVDFTKIGKVQFEGKTYVVAFGKVLLCLTPDEQEPSDPEERLELKSDSTELLVNEEAIVYFEAVGEKNQTVELYNGNNKFVGTMLDDGSNGDVTKDDGIYTLSISITPQIREKYRYYAKSDIKSNNIEISTFNIEDFEKDDDLISEIDSTINSIAGEYVYHDSIDDRAKSAANTYDKLVEYVRSLKNKEGIKDVVIEGFTFTVELPLRTYSYTFSIDPNVLASSNDGNKNSIATLEPSKSQFNTPVYDDAANSIANSLKSYNFVANLDSEQVTLDSIRNLSDKRVIIWNGHGDYRSREHSVLKIPTQKDSIKKYKNDFANRLLIDYGDSIGVTSKFFEKYYRNQRFNDSLIYLGACLGAYDDTLVNTLLSLGAKTVLAFDNIVDSTYNQNLCKRFFYMLVNTEIVSGKTYMAYVALNDAKSIYGERESRGALSDLITIFGMNIEEKIVFEQDFVYFLPTLRIYGDDEFRLSDYDFEPYDPEPEDPEPSDGLITEDDSPDNYGTTPVYYAFIATDDELGMLPPGKSKFENNVPESWQVNINNTRSDLRYHDSSLDEFDEQGRLTKVTYVSKVNSNRYITFSRESDYRFDGSYIVKVHNHLADEGTDYCTYDPNSKRFLEGYWNFEYDNQGRLKRLFITPGKHVYYSVYDGYREKFPWYDEMIFSYEESNNALYQKYCAYKNGEKVYSGKVQIVNSNDSTILLEKKRLKRTGSLTERRLIIPDSFKGQSIMSNGYTYSYDERGNLTWCGGNTLRYELSY